MQHELICTEPATPPCLAVRDVERRAPRADQVLVQVQATSVNPIDVKRAGGYGHRLLGLKGAGRFPMVLGNDIAGIVSDAGAGVTRFARGQRVFGLLGTGRTGGAHASHILVPQDLLRPAPLDVESPALAVLPYSFTTMWLALRSTGIRADNARGARVLVNGANGGLGRLALQTLHHWGSEVTAICGKGQRQVALDLGARLVVEHGPDCVRPLPPTFDVVLNFANWDDEAALASRLGSTALGHATTVHPLLSNFDRMGWFGGVWTSRRDRSRIRAIVSSRAPKATYAWTIFKPDREALDVLSEGVAARRLSLPIGMVKSFQEAHIAFDHVSSGKPGRAVLLAA